MDLVERAARLDAADPLAILRDRFLPADGVVAYLDGNSLGRPLQAAVERMERFVRADWGGRLIRGWDEEWIAAPGVLGDRLGAVALGAAAGQTVIADSTTVLLYKLARAAVDATVAEQPGRREIVVGTDDFPTDRYVLEGIAAERGLVLRWVETDPEAGLTREQLAAVVCEATALVVTSHVAYRSAYVVDLAGITADAHAAGALVLADLSHSVGVVPVALDAWGVDLAVGCTYKYLGGGPGSPAFAYRAARHHDRLRQPLWGWFGRRDAFAMAPGYEPAAGATSLLSGTPPILAMVPLRCGIDLLAEAGPAAVRAKSVALTGFAIEVADELLAPHGVTVASPRDDERRGGHVMLRHPDARTLTATLWRHGVIPDFREPDGLRVGLAPLSTSFAEVLAGLSVLAELLRS